MSTLPLIMLSINFLTDFDVLTKSEDNIASLAFGKIADVSSASLSIPGPIASKEPDASHFGQSLTRSLLSPHW